MTTPTTMTDLPLTEPQIDELIAAYQAQLTATAAATVAELDAINAARKLAVAGGDKLAPKALKDAATSTVAAVQPLQQTAVAASYDLQTKIQAHITAAGYSAHGGCRFDTRRGVIVLSPAPPQEDVK